jgi:hypothetical protein
VESSTLVESYLRSSVRHDELDACKYYVLCVLAETTEERKSVDAKEAPEATYLHTTVQAGGMQSRPIYMQACKPSHGSDRDNLPTSCDHDCEL